MISLSVFGLFLLPKIFLNVFFGWYGFALAMPAALLLVAGSAYHLPAIVRRRGGCGATARAACAVLVLLCIAAHARHSMRCYQDMNFPVGAGRDRFLTFDPFVTKLGPVFAEALAAIETHMPPDAGFVVIPEGVMLNYLARRRNPTRWFEFHPTYLAAVGENHVLDDLEAARPGYVVLTELKTAKLGADYFGTDYGLSLRDWIVRNYEPAYHAGDPLYRYQDFGIVIAKRNGRAAP